MKPRNTQWLEKDRKSQSDLEKEVADDIKTGKRARQKAREGKSPSTQAGEFVREEIHHVRKGKHGARSPKQAIAIGLSKARKAGVPLPPRGRKAPSSSGKRRPQNQPSARRSRAILGALQREPREAGSRRALSAQARKAARSRGPEARRQSARKAVRTKGPQVLREEARKAARTRKAG